MFQTMFVVFHQSTVLIAFLDHAGLQDPILSLLVDPTHIYDRSVYFFFIDFSEDSILFGLNDFRALGQSDCLRIERRRVSIPPGWFARAELTATPG